MAHTTKASFTSITPRQIRVIGVPLDLGQSRRGVDMGPSAVRVAGLEARLEAIGHIVEDAGNIAVAIPEQKKAGIANAKYLKEITATCTKAADVVLKTLEAGKVPLVLGGDHSVAAGTVSGVAEFYRRQNQKIGLGQRAQADSVEVRWPSGQVDRLSNVKAGQTITIREAQGQVAAQAFRGR